MLFAVDESWECDTLRKVLVWERTTIYNLTFAGHGGGRPMIDEDSDMIDSWHGRHSRFLHCGGGGGSWLAGSLLTLSV